MGHLDDSSDDGQADASDEGSSSSSALSDVSDSDDNARSPGVSPAAAVRQAIAEQSQAAQEQFQKRTQGNRKALVRGNTRRLGVRMLPVFLNSQRSSLRTMEVLLDAGVVSHYLARDFIARKRALDNVRRRASRRESRIAHRRPTTICRAVGANAEEADDASSETDFASSSEDDPHTAPDKASAIAARNRLLFAVQAEVLKSWRYDDGNRRNSRYTFVTSLPECAPERGSQRVNRFKKKVKEMCLSLRESKLLNTEVDIVAMNYKLRPQGAQRSNLKKVERSDRNDAFWRLYHQDDGKRHLPPALDHRQQKGHRVSAVSSTASPLMRKSDMRVAASMVATSSKFWTPSQNAELSDAKPAHGLPGSKADVKAARQPTNSGKATTRRLLQHRSVVHQRRMQSNEASGSATLRTSQSLPTLGRKAGRHYDESPKGTHEAVLQSSKALQQWGSPSASRTSWRSGTRGSDQSEDDEMMGTKNGYWDLGKFLDTRSSFKRAGQSVHRQMKMNRSRKEEMIQTVSLPALSYASRRGIRHPVEVEEATRKSSVPHAAEAEAMQRSSSDSKLPSLSAAGKSGNSMDGKLPSAAADKLSNSSSVPVLRGSWKPPEKLAPVVSLPKAYDRAAVRAPNRNSGELMPQLEADVDEATTRYIRVCRAAGVVPTPSVLTMAETHKISGDDFVDDDLCAFAAMVRSLDHLESVDLAGNALLSDRALVPFLRKLFGRPASSTLTWLSLEGCKGAARGAIDTTVSLLSDPDGLFRLVHVNLSGVAIPASSQLAFCKAVADHGQLRSVHLADVGLGIHPSAKFCVTSLLTAKLEELDLGWNCFTSDVFEALGQEVGEHKTLTKLHIASCAAVTASGLLGESPVTWFLECLSRNRMLTSLDVSLNRIDYRGALVLEDALDSHKKLTDLRLGQNPLGVGGMRSFLRLLSRESSGLKHFECGQCEGQTQGAGDEPAFNATDPTGRYVLNLSNPYHRSQLRMLYKTCERFSLAPAKAFLNVEYLLPGPAAGTPAKTEASGKGVYRHPKEKDARGVWCVPNSGVLTLYFSMVEMLNTVFNTDSLAQSAKENKRSSVQGGGQVKVSELGSSTRARICWIHHDSVVRDQSLAPIASRFLERYMACVKYMPSIRKVVPLLAQWQSLKGQPREQQLLLDALSRDFLLTFGHIHQFCRVRSRTIEVLSKLLHCMEGGPVQLYMALTFPKKLDDFLKVYNACQRLFHFNAENPTAHYQLDLGNTRDYAIGEALVLIDRWEAAMARKKGCCDVSQHGNWSNFRNIVYQNHEITSVEEFQLPSHDTIQFDFVSWRRPPSRVPVLGDECWEQLMVMLAQSECKADAKVKTLRIVSDQFWMKCLQLRELLNAFQEAINHVEVVCIFWLRLADVQNTKLVRARLTDHEGVWNMIRHRMGILTVYPTIQPEQFHFDLNLSKYEDRMAVALTFALAVRETPGMENIRDLSLVLPDGKLYNFAKGAPPSWERYEEVHTAGWFHCRYSCAPTDRRLAVRKEFAFKYCGFNTSDIDTNIMWWSHLTEAPEAVIFFLCYCLRHFKDMAAPFKTIAGSSGQGSNFVSLDSMRKQVNQWGWKKFMKNPLWVTQVFRYLDPDGDGEVTSKEWGCLVQLFKELQLAILELMKYLNRAFMGNFDMAWDEIDADGSNSIDFEEWLGAMKYIGFTGSSDAIFRYLSDDNKDLINVKGWNRLKDLWRERAELGKKIAATNYCM